MNMPGALAQMRQRRLAGAAQALDLRHVVQDYTN
jgi:hypothetical protein